MKMNELILPYSVILLFLFICCKTEKKITRNASLQQVNWKALSQLLTIIKEPPPLTHYG